jgi:hypothetical protein
VCDADDGERADGAARTAARGRADGAVRGWTAARGRGRGRRRVGRTAAGVKMKVKGEGRRRRGYRSV